MPDRRVPKSVIKRHAGKIETVMGEFKRRTLRSSAGPKVTNRKQAIAIALSEAERADRRK